VRVLIAFVTIFLSCKIYANPTYPDVRTFYHNKELDKALNKIKRLELQGNNDAVLIYYKSKVRILRLRSNYALNKGYQNLNKLNLSGARVNIKEATAYYPDNPRIKVFIQELQRLKGIKPEDYLSPELRRKYAGLIQEATEEKKKENEQRAISYYEAARNIFGGDISINQEIKRLRSIVRGKKSKKRMLSLQARYNEKIRRQRYIAAAGVLEQILIVQPMSQMYLQEKGRLSSLIAERRISRERERLAREHYDIGTNFFKRKNFKGAIEQYQQGLAVSPRLKNWSRLIKDVQKRSREERKRKFNQTIKKIENLFQAGISYSAKEKYQDAIASFGKVIELSEQYDQKETKKQAEELQKQSVESLNTAQASKVNIASPYYKLVNSLSQLGLAAYKKKEYNLAKKYFSDILQLFPKNSEANLYYISASIELRPETKSSIIINFQSDVRNDLEKKYEANRLLKLLEALDRSNRETKELRKQYRIIHNKVISKVDRKKITRMFATAKRDAASSPKESLKTLKKILKIDPKYPGARALTARIEGRLSRTKWDIPLKPTNQEAQNHYAKGMLYYNAGDISKAFRSFSQAVKADPEFQKARSALNKCKSYLAES
jgi:tetratricopeptide (TPR) repeat protein